MAAYDYNKSIDTKKIIIEETSTSTEETPAFSRSVIAKEKPKIAIITTSYHLFRTLLLAKQKKFTSNDIYFIFIFIFELKN